MHVRTSEDDQLLILVFLLISEIHYRKKFGLSLAILELSALGRFLHFLMCDYIKCNDFALYTGECLVLELT